MNKSQIYEALYKQNDIRNMKCLEEIRTEIDKDIATKNGYQIPYTKSEWESLYPSIPAKFIFYPKVCLYASDPLYIDIEHYIVFQTRLYGTDYLSYNGSNFEDDANDFIKKQMEHYQNKNYYKLLQPILSEGSGNIAIYMMNSILEKEPISENLYQTFMEIYTYVDNGISNLSNTAKERLFQSKSEEQKKKTKEKCISFSEEIIIYRGEGSKSTSYKNAFSWTTDINIAYFFASRQGGEQARLITGKIKKENIFEYIKNRSEEEVIVYPEDVEIIDVHNFIKQDDFIRTIGSDMNAYKNVCDTNKFHHNTLIEEVKKAYRYIPNEIKDHTKDHTLRVLLYASYLFRKVISEKYEKSNKQQKTYIMSCYQDLLEAAIYHDIGRENDDIDDKHGIASYKIYKKQKKDNKIVQFLIENHCIDDNVSRETLTENIEINHNIVWQLYEILKDADALDRTRFGRGDDGLNIKYLRLEESKDLVPVANTFSQYHI